MIQTERVATNGAAGQTGCQARFGKDLSRYCILLKENCNAQ